MKQKHYNLLIYFIALSPLITGSSLFFWWLYQRMSNAVNRHIDVLAFFTIMGFLIFSIVTLLLSITYYSKFKSYAFVPALLIVFFTIPVIFLYGTLYDNYSEEVFLQLNNDKPGYKSARIWSDHFELTGLQLLDDIAVVHYRPAYTYNWKKEDSFGYEYAVNKTYIDLLTSDGKTVTCELPAYEKGSCEEVHVSSLRIKK